DSVEEAVKAIANGEMVVVVDDDDRENEGDLIAAASKITPEQMAIMVRHGTGIVCLPITGEDARRLKLDHVIDNMSGDLSGGQKKLLEIGRALMGSPKLILLDEPVAGVNPTLGMEIADRIKELVAEDGLTFLIVEHDMDIISRLCDHIVVMANGTDLMEGSFEEVISSHAVQDAYLGKRA
ncbi:MAG: 3,4-dihydroxy-2-butanone-4-phosphate synthase, partial [Geminicoccaceae bacterium]|nr:3,4-dihydroxy-2-butanone-4-phosphate synthase [Geminicoccaceae bacterium]